MIDKRKRNDILSSLWQLTVDELIKQLKHGIQVANKDGEVETISPTPALLAVVIKFLKDNEIDLTDPANANQKMADLLAAASKKVQTLDDPEHISD